LTIITISLLHSYIPKLPDLPRKKAAAEQKLLEFKLKGKHERRLKPPKLPLQKKA